MVVGRKIGLRDKQQEGAAQCLLIYATGSKTTSTLS